MNNSPEIEEKKSENILRTKPVKGENSKIIKRIIGGNSRIYPIFKGQNF